MTRLEAALNGELKTNAVDTRAKRIKALLSLSELNLSDDLTKAEGELDAALVELGTNSNVEQAIRKVGMCFAKVENLKQDVLDQQRFIGWLTYNENAGVTE